MGELAEELTRSLADNNFAKASSIVKDPKCVSQLRRDFDLIRMLLSNVSEKVMNENNELKMCCENLLEIVAREAEPEEVVLEFLEQMDGVDCVNFEFILKLLNASLPRCRQNRLRFMELALVSVRTYLEELFITDGRSATEEHDEEFSQRITQVDRVLNCTIDFYSLLVSEIEEETWRNVTGEAVAIISSRLIQLFDLFLPVDGENHFLSLSEIQLRAVTLILKLVKDPFYLLTYLNFGIERGKCEKDEKRNMNSEDLRTICDDLERFDSSEHVSLYENNFVISKLGYSIFFYLVVCNRDEWNIKIPMVYNPKYVFLSLAPLTTSFFERNNDEVIERGFMFLQALLRILNGLKLERLELYFHWHETILVQLNYLMVYSQTETIRKCALQCFKQYIDTFDYEAKYLLLMNFHSRVQHSGTLGFLITSLKCIIGEVIYSDVNEKFHRFYSGKKLYDMIARYCFLRCGEKTDLVEYADQIISSLNLLRFLVIKDGENKTGIKDYLDKIDKFYLQPLKNDISSSKEFYETKLLECGKSTHEEGTGLELTINGQPFTHLSKDEQRKALLSSLNAVDLINSLLLRLVECIHEKC